MIKRRDIPMYIILIIASLFALVPFIWILLSSFKNTVELFTGPVIPEVWRWQNYLEAWTRGRIGLLFRNSLYITIVAPTLSIIFNSLTGYAFAKLRLRNYTWLFYFFLISLFIPMEANLLSVSLQVGVMGLHNSLNGVVLAVVAGNIAFGSFMMRNFFKDIPDSFGESAKIDGAGIFTTFIFIYIPLAKSAITALTIFTLIGAWNEFNLSLFILTNSDMWTIPIGMRSLMGNLGATSFGLVFAGSVIVIVPIIVFYIIFQRSFIEGISAGAMKG